MLCGGVFYAAKPQDHLTMPGLVPLRVPALGKVPEHGDGASVRDLLPVRPTLGSFVSCQILLDDHEPV
ncbi:hypothetical protein RD1_1931 [Roseobacter denitrificans OCh 114]|uniref:Uncharacterized protein n=1 Tax=Roseobacter denitrificans (strain ATCC 33942 / OCh 114) TaxID=375451 RepID=Q168Q3_ROSDO|nr:hypothetical protein RD1_1931 [Roseobacter denitrificans OCh 114]